MNASALDRMMGSAVAMKRLLRIRYKGCAREVEPHDYGMQKGVERLFVYELGRTPPTPGPSVAGWRLLDLPKIEDCEVWNQSFAGSRGHLHSKRSIWDVLYVRVA